MDFDSIIIYLIITIAVAYIVVTYVKKYKRLMASDSDACCGGNCEHCPFSKDREHGCVKPSPTTHKRITGFSPPPTK